MKGYFVAKLLTLFIYTTSSYVFKRVSRSYPVVGYVTQIRTNGVSLKPSLNKSHLRLKYLFPNTKAHSLLLGRENCHRPRTALYVILDDVRQVVADQLGVDIEKVNANSRFIEDLQADSLDSVELVMAFEEKFKVDIPDKEATSITSVQQALDYINARQQPADTSSPSA